MEIDRIPLFATLSDAERRALAASLQERAYAPGQVMFFEEDRADRLYMIVSGEVEIYKSPEGELEQILGVRGAGELLGEMSLFDRNSRRSASARARAPVRVLEFTHGAFLAILQRHPEIALKIVRVLSERLRESDGRLIEDLRQKNVALRQAYEELKAAQRQLVEKERLERELELAREIQSSILPQQAPIAERFEFGARIHPAREVGGDLFDFFELDKHHIGIAIGDVSDKGAPAAIFMALVRSLLRAEARRGGSPASVLRNVNRNLIEMNPTSVFVTALYGILDLKTGEFGYARAGHELPLFISPKGDLGAMPMDTGQPLGLFPEPDLDQQSVPLAPGSWLVLLTDGVTDALNSSQEFFGMDRLKKSLLAGRHGSAQQMCDELLFAVQAFQGDAPQFDDLTVVILRAM